MESPYEIPNLENQKNDVGTCQKPFFYHITTGKFISKSAVFHAQIQQKYDETASVFETPLQFTVL